MSVSGTCRDSLTMYAHRAKRTSRRKAATAVFKPVSLMQINKLRPDLWTLAGEVFFP